MPVDIPLRARDEASKAFQSASERLAELRAQIDAIRGKGVDITVGDTRTLNRLTADANRLERTLGTAGASGTQMAQSLTGSFGRLGSVLGGLDLGALGTLGGLATGAGLAAAAVGAGKLALSLEQMREESAQLEARFVGFTGSTRNADAAMQAFDETLGNALSKDQKMASAAQLMGLGLAATAQEAATLTNQALILGMSVDTLTQALETGRATGLVQYGISVTDLKTRVGELQAANANLSDAEAKQIAIKEQLAAKSQAVAEAGGVAATATQELGNAFDTFKDTVADFVNLEGAIRGVTGAVQGATEYMQSASEADVRGLGMDMARADREAAAQTALALADAEAELTMALASGVDQVIANAQAHVEAARAKNDAAQATATLAEAEWNRMMAAGAVDDGERAYIADMEAATAATREAAGAVDDVSGALSKSKTYWEKWAGFAEEAAKRVSKASLAAQSARWAQGQTGEPESKWGAATAWAQSQARGLGTGFFEKSVQDWLADQKDANTDAATHFKTQYEIAAEQAVGKFKGLMSEGIEASINLKDLRPDWMKPGANGPYEDIFRLQDVAVNGPDRSTWDEFLEQKYKIPDIGQEFAQQIVAAFQSSNFTPEVQQFVDKEKLVAILQRGQAAEQSTMAYAEELAQAAGISMDKALAGMGLKPQQQGQTPPQQAAAPVTASYNLYVQAGAVAVTTNDPKAVADKLVGEVFRAFQRAESRVGTPALAGTPGAR